MWFKNFVHWTGSEPKEKSGYSKWDVLEGGGSVAHEADPQEISGLLTKQDGLMCDTKDDRNMTEPWILFVVGE